MGVIEGGGKAEMSVVKAAFQSWFFPRVNFVILTYHLLPWASVSLLKPGILPFRVVGGHKLRKWNL